MTRNEAAAKAREAEQRSRLQRGYLPILAKTQKHPVLTLSAAALVLVATVAVSPLLATDLLGRSGENSMTVRRSSGRNEPEATSDEATKVEDMLRGMDGIKDVQVTSGNAQSGFAALTSTGSSNSTFTIVTDEKANQKKLQDDVRSKLRGAAGKISVGSAGRIWHIIHGGHHHQSRQCR